MLQLTSNKLFYRRYPYKLVVNHPALVTEYGYSYRDIEAEFSNVRTRYESNRLSIFCLDAETFDIVSGKFKLCVLELHRPASEQEAQYLTESNTRVVLCDKLPHDLYRYKIYFLVDTPISTRKNLSAWLKNYVNRIHVSNGTKAWLAITTLRWSTRAPFICVDDSNMASMIGLFMGDRVKYVERFVLRSSINTETNEEPLVCQP